MYSTKSTFFFPEFEGASKRGEAESTATGGPKIYSLQWPHVVKDFERQQWYTWKFDADICDVSCIYYTRKGSQWSWPGFRSKSRRLCG